MLVLCNSTFAEDEHGNEVFLAAGDFVSEISDAGAVEASGVHWEPTRGDITKLVPSALGRWVDGKMVVGWNVTVRFTPSHKQWTELVTIDAVRLLKALDEQS